MRLYALGCRVSKLHSWHSLQMIRIAFTTFTAEDAKCIHSSCTHQVAEDLNCVNRIQRRWSESHSPHSLQRMQIVFTAVVRTRLQRTQEQSAWVRPKASMSVEAMVSCRIDTSWSIADIIFVEKVSGISSLLHCAGSKIPDCLTRVRITRRTISPRYKPDTSFSKTICPGRTLSASSSLSSCTQPAAVLQHSKLNKPFSGCFDPAKIFLDSETNNFPGDVTNVSAKQEPLDSSCR